MMFLEDTWENGLGCSSMIAVVEIKEAIKYRISKELMQMKD